jgi:NADH:ubiquinone oxidoreductase subunit 3 (subunit A)
MYGSHIVRKTYQIFIPEIQFLFAVAMKLKSLRNYKTVAMSVFQFVQKYYTHTN